MLSFGENFWGFFASWVYDKAHKKHNIYEDCISAEDCMFGKGDVFLTCVLVSKIVVTIFFPLHKIGTSVDSVWVMVVL